MMGKSSWYIYMLRCKDQSLYVGITNDVMKRVNAHNRGKGSKFVRSRLPAMLVYQETAEDESDAKKREAEIKKLSKTQKEELIPKTS